MGQETSVSDPGARMIGVSFQECQILLANRVELVPNPECQGFPLGVVFLNAIHVIVDPRCNLCDGGVIGLKDLRQFLFRVLCKDKQCGKAIYGKMERADHRPIIVNGKGLAIFGWRNYGRRMSLEDHIGDICRKARLQTKTDLAQCAAAAGLSEVELQAWETDGVISAAVNVHALAGLIGLDPDKAGGVAGGWAPRPVDLRRWPELRVVTTTDGFEVNSFVMWDAKSRETAIFDTGWHANDLFKLAEDHRLKVTHLFITHMHGDHVAAMGDVRNRWPGIQVHSNNRGAPAKNRVQEGVPVGVGSLNITPRLTPGHAEDGVTYVVDHWPNTVPAVAVVGDAIFAGSMGKDFQTPELAREKVRAEILSLPSDTLICPGHGPLTTVGEERAHNPFF